MMHTSTEELQASDRNAHEERGNDMMTLEMKQAVFTQIAERAGNTPTQANMLGIIAANFIELPNDVRLQAIAETKKMNLPDIAELMEGLHARYDQNLKHK